MKGLRPFLFLIAAIVAVACLVFSGPSRTSHRITHFGRLTDEHEVRDPITFRNLAIFPVTSKAPRNEDRFITLDEGLKAGTIEILERGVGSARGVPNQIGTPQTTDPFAPAQNAPSPPADPFAAPRAANAAPTNPPQITADPFAEPPSLTAARSASSNSVNELMVVNHSDKPLYLMPGEIVIGGSQDRTIGQELVVAPDHQPVPLSVYCVEHGRWGGRDRQTYANLLQANNGPGSIESFDANLSLAVDETTERANAGKFVGSIGSLNKPARIAVQSGEGQAKVWDEVSAENAKNQLQPSTGTFSVNYSDAESVERLSPYLEQLLNPIEKTENVVGVIVAVNGKVESMDIFESTPLFRKLWPKLLKSYALDASNAEGESQATCQTAARSAALDFLREVAKARADTTNTSDALALSKGESDRVLLFSAHERRTPSTIAPIYGIGGGIGGGMGGMAGEILGDAIHSSGFAK